MNQRDRFLALIAGDKPDYIPIFGMDEAPGFSGGVMRTTYDNLLDTGMPDVGGVWELDGACRNQQGWRDYWGVCGPINVDEFPGTKGENLHWEKRVEHGFEVVECETGAMRRQVLNNDITYSMPEYIRFHVRDWASWEYYKAKRSAGNPFTKEQRARVAKKYENCTEPVRIALNASFGPLRDLLGPELGCTIFYDDPGLARDILAWLQEENRRFLLPLVEAVKPDIISMSEDICYNHGLFISPEIFREFCAPIYRDAAEVAKKVGVPLFVVDTDGFAEHFVPLLEELGVNGIFPWEVKSNNDLNRVRASHPDFVLMGGIEKEIANAGNEGLIRDEIFGKIPSLLASGRYLPNGDHGIQPLVTFKNLCMTMTALHEVCENPEGCFPRMKPARPL